MIAAIADDFTGAAELAGISLQYGLRVALFVSKVTDCEADVMIVSTDSRSLPLQEAIDVTRGIVKKVTACKPEWMYKKIDSVLRGYVLEELNVQMQFAEVKKCFILPANPSLGRIIQQGEYFIDGKRIHETAFSKDPEFPIKSSLITEMLGSNISVLEINEELPQQGIVVGEAGSKEDLENWAARLDASWLIAGAGDFYKALLQKDRQPVFQREAQLQHPHLYICGTAFAQRQEFIKQVEKQLQCVLYLPNNLTDEWVVIAGKMITEKERLIIAINDDYGYNADELRKQMAHVARAVIGESNVKEIFIEGGSTATALFREMGIKQLTPVQELSRGVVRSKTGDLFITVKPGSYELPHSILRIYE